MRLESCITLPIESHQSMAELEVLACQVRLLGLPPLELVLALRRPIFRLPVLLYLVFSFALTVLVIKFKGPNSAVASLSYAATWFGLLTLAVKVEFRRVE